MINALFVLLISLLSACGKSTLDGTYSNNMTGVAEQKMSIIFKPDGTSNMSIGSTTVPLEIPYEVSGNKLKIHGAEKDINTTIMDDGDFIIEGMRFKKVGAK